MVKQTKAMKVIPAKKKIKAKVVGIELFKPSEIYALQGMLQTMDNLAGKQLPTWHQPAWKKLLAGTEAFVKALSKSEN